MARRETYLTSEGLAKIETEMEHLRAVVRQEIARRIHEATELGGTVDNAEYEESKNEQAFVEGRILTLATMIQSAVLIPDDRTPSDRVEVGSMVTVEDPQGNKQRYSIVGSSEADPSERKISNESPVGMALLGRKAKDKTQVTTPSGTITYTIIRIE